jgi:hypothetical protein
LLTVGFLADACETAYGQPITYSIMSISTDILDPIFCSTGVTVLTNANAVHSSSVAHNTLSDRQLNVI